MSVTNPMEIVVIGGSGLIGSKLVTLIRAHGHEVVSASPQSGVDTLTGRGLAQALAAAQVVVDVANSPSFEDTALLAFFETSGRKLIAAETAAGVSHHVAPSVVGTDRLQGSAYFRGKAAQERLIKASNMRHTIVHSTQFFEFVGGIAQSGTSADQQVVSLSPTQIQPIASDDIAVAMADFATGLPLDGTVEVAGPQRMRLHELVQAYLASRNDPRVVVPDVQARCFGAELDDDTLLPGPDARLGTTCFADWLGTQKEHQRVRRRPPARPSGLGGSGSITPRRLSCRSRG
jgi:uncharacterized protein YbjT (DUF2867 family)